MRVLRPVPAAWHSRRYRLAEVERTAARVADVDARRDAALCQFIRDRWPVAFEGPTFDEFRRRYPEAAPSPPGRLGVVVGDVAYCFLDKGKHITIEERRYPYDPTRPWGFMNDVHTLIVALGTPAESVADGRLRYIWFVESLEFAVLAEVGRGAKPEADTLRVMGERRPRRSGRS